MRTLREAIAESRGVRPAELRLRQWRGTSPTGERMVDIYVHGNYFSTAGGQKSHFSEVRDMKCFDIADDEVLVLPRGFTSLIVAEKR